MAKELLKTIWPEWTLGERIGAGSYGEVYEAIRSDYNVEGHAAIKIISIPNSEAEVDSLRADGMDLEASKTYLQNVVTDFVNEIQLMVSLEGSPNIVDVKDYRVVEKTEGIGWYIFIRMELLTSFGEYISDKKLSEADVIKLGCDICTALEICEKQNIIHRDIKPGNILVHKNGTFKLGDFGIARKLVNVSGGLSQKGTRNYMAPEVATSTKYDKRVDIYSLGLVLYRLLNEDRMPFLESKQLRSPLELERAIERRIQGEAIPIPIKASPEMADLILRACAFDPDKRFSSATEMKQALMDVANGTYQIINPELATEKQTESGQNIEDEYEKTTAVRKAPEAKKPSVDTESASVNTFGTSGKKPKKKRSKKFFLFILLVLVGVWGVPKLTDKLQDDDTTVTEEQKDTDGVTNEKEEVRETEDYSRKDDKKIAAIIEEAEALEESGELEQAAEKIAEGLVTYPKSANLQSKADELNEQIKEKELAEAKSFADSGDYVAAMNLIKNAQDTYGNDVDYQNAYDIYENEHINVIINEAEVLATEEDYEGALTKIQTGLVTYPNSVDFKNKADEYTKALNTQNKEKTLAEAAALADIGDYTSAMSVIEVAQKKYGSDKEYEEAYSSYQATFALTTAENYAISGELQNAITTISDAKEDNPTNVDLIVAYNSYSSSYITEILDKADMLMLERSYSMAIEVINEGLRILPNNSNLMDKLAEIESSKPVSLANLSAFNGGWEWNNLEPMDSFGNNYSSACNYVVFSDYYGNILPQDGFLSKETNGYRHVYAEYRVVGGYTYLTMQLAPYYSICTDGKAFVQIYADDTLIYTSPIINRKTEAFVCEVDISKAEYVKILVNVYIGNGIDGSDEGAILIADAQFWPN